MDDLHNETPLVSIIIPIYNVRKYLEKCIRTVREQSYTNIEIILVDDGSTDGSGDECDKFAKEDERIIVIHKKNGGLSDARNYGLDKARGDYIVFVDSDDYINGRMIELMLNCYVKEEYDLVICLDKAVYDDYGEEDDKKFDASKVRTITPKEVLDDSLVTAWNKMYKSETWKELRFPVGRYHEDEFLLHRIVYGMRKIALIPTCLYYYRQRENSIVHTYSSKKMWDAFDAYCDRLRFIKETGWRDVSERTIYIFTNFVIKYYFEGDNSILLEDRNKLYAAWKSVLVETSFRPKKKFQMAFYKSPTSFLRLRKWEDCKGKLIVLLSRIKHSIYNR